MKNKIAVIGGDMRQIYMANLMAKKITMFTFMVIDTRHLVVTFTWQRL